VIEIASGDRPSDHSTDIFKCPPSCYRGFADLSVYHPGYVSPVKLSQRDMPDDREDIPAQSALDLWG
jgi:hypothetical protein